VITIESNVLAASDLKACSKTSVFSARGKRDSFHVALAFKEKRFLLIRSGRPKLNDREIPFHRIHGIVVTTADPRERDGHPSGRQPFKLVLTPLSAIFS
jgi:hypothetical protein